MHKPEDALEYTETDAALGKPIALFRIDNTVYKVTLRGMDAADDWLDQFIKPVADALAAHQADRSDRTKRRAYLDLVKDAVLTFGELPETLPVEKITAAQFIQAYSELCKVTDPLEFSNYSATRKVKRMVEGIPGLNSAAVDRELRRASENGSQPSPSTTR